MESSQPVTNVNVTHELRNVVVNISTSGKYHKVDGSSFVIDFHDNNYFHFIVDQLAQFLYLKSINANLKLVLVYPQTFEFEWQEWINERLRRHFEFIEVSEQDTRQVLLDCLVFISNKFNPFYANVDGPKIDLMLNQEYYQKIIPVLSTFLKKNIPHTEPRKIYISRRNKSRKYLKEMAYLQLLRANGVSWDYETRTINDPQNFMQSSERQIEQDLLGIEDQVARAPWVCEIDSMLRYLSPEEEDMIEEIFVSLGYTIIRDDNFEEQLSAIGSAKEVAFFVGASSINTVVAPPDAKIIILDHDTRYPFDAHHYIPKVMHSNIYEYLDRDLYPNTRNVNELVRLLLRDFPRV